MTRARLRAHICMCIRARVPARTREYHKAFQKSIARKGKHKKIRLDKSDPDMGKASMPRYMTRGLEIARGYNF